MPDTPKLSPSGRPRSAAALRLGQLEQNVEALTRELEEAREQAIRLIETDQLTALPNRICFTTRAEILLGDELRNGSRFALLIVDLDQFRKVNNALGHEAGDALLQHVAMQLFFCAGNADIVARLGGDEFALLVRSDDGHTVLDRIASEVLQAVREPVNYLGRTLQSTCSIGIARFPDDGTQISQLQRHAYLALDRSKLSRSTFTIYDPELGRQNAARQALGEELAEAIRTGQIEPWFQPIYDHASGQIVSAEALARWRHPTRGLLTPAQFLDLAEERGLMHELFACMLRAACPIIRRRVGVRGLESLSINVSPSQFIGRNVAEDIIGLLRDLELPATALTIEITEEVLMQEFGHASAQLEQLASHGVRIALDDFGVGYSNIDYLRRLSFHTLKIDRSLIVDVTTEPKVRSILTAILGLANALDLTVVTEGVETEAQSNELAHLGFRRQQGYLHGRPVPCVAFEHAITSSNCHPASGVMCDCPHSPARALIPQ